METAGSPAAWHVLAMDLGGQFITGDAGVDRAVLPVGDWTVVLEGVAEVQASLMPGARLRRRVRRTRLRAPYRGLDSLRLAIEPRRGRELVPGLRPITGFQLGDEAFDRAFACRVTEVSKARELLEDAELRARLLAQPELHLSMHEVSGPRDADQPPVVELCLDERGVLADLDRLKELVALLGALLDGLGALGAAEPALADEIVVDPLASRAGAMPQPAQSAPTLNALPREVPIACFFCARPLRLDEAHIEEITLSGDVLHPLACDPHHAALGASRRPTVLGRTPPRVEGDEDEDEDADVASADIPWFLDAGFRPSWDFEPRASGPLLTWAALPAPTTLFTPQPIAIVHADDPRWHALGGTAPVAAAAAVPDPAPAPIA